MLNSGKKIRALRDKKNIFYLIGLRKETMSYIYLFPVLFILLYNKYYIVTDNTCRF
jgi:hypothetical protein